MGSRIAVASYFINQDYAVNKVLETLGIYKTTWYRYNKEQLNRRKFNPGRPVPGYSYDRFGGKIEDHKIISAINEIRCHEYLGIAGGYKKMKRYLYNFYGYIVNQKKTYRLCKENNLILHKKDKREKSRRRVSINRKVTAPNQVWEFDIKYGYIHGWNKFFYILVYIDVFSRSIMHYYIGLRCQAKHLASSFTTALRKSGIDKDHKLVIRSDNGPQMTSKQFYNYLLHEVKHRVEHEFIPCAMPNKNAHVESFYSIVESEFIAIHYFKDFKDVYIKFVNFVEFYNATRVHGSLKYRTPKEVLSLYAKNSIPLDIKPPTI